MDTRTRGQRWLVPTVLCLAAAVGAGSMQTATLRAQWLNYRSKNVPRTATGKADLNAPAPRTADGKPDFSGIWDIEHNRPCPPDGCADLYVGLEFTNIGATLKGGLPYLPWAAAITKKRTEDLRLEDPNSFCLPIGIVRMHTMPLLRKVMQSPDMIAILYEHQVTYRQIFTDGRPLPVDPNPSWSGYSSGAWEGDTLVVHSAGFRENIWLDANGSPLSPDARITERFRRVSFGKMEIELTVDDLKAYRTPWTVKLNQFLVTDTDLLDYVCTENERDAKHLVGK